MALEDYETAIESDRQHRGDAETLERLRRQGDLLAQKLHNSWLIHREVLDQCSRAYNTLAGARR